MKVGLTGLSIVFGLLALAFETNAAFRLSFLDHEASQKTARRLLKEAGCRQETLNAFFRVVKMHNQELLYDRSNFGDQTDGWYSFKSPDQLLQKMPYAFHDVQPNPNGPDQHSLVCFSIAALLLRDHARESVSPSLWPKDSHFIRGWKLNQRDDPVVDHTPVDGSRVADRELYPLNGYKHFTGETTRSEIEEGIAVGLRGLRGTPQFGPNDTRAIRSIVQNKLSDLQQKGIRLDGPMRVLMVHFLRPDEQVIGLTHVGLLMGKNDQFYFLEKNGSPGPFVFVRSDDRQQIVEYVTRHYGASYRAGDNFKLEGAILAVSVGVDIVKIKVTS